MNFYPEPLLFQDMPLLFLFLLLISFSITSYIGVYLTIECFKRDASLMYKIGYMIYTLSYICLSLITLFYIIHIIFYKIRNRNKKYSPIILS